MEGVENQDLLDQARNDDEPIDILDNGDVKTFKVAGQEIANRRIGEDKRL